MIKDPVIVAFAIGLGLGIGWLIIDILDKTSRGFRRGFRKIKCKCGFHAPSGRYEPAVGGRDVMRCLYCDIVVHYVERTKGSLRRSG
jgi:hypothetical protein